ncbi:hypothetical protein ACRB68_68050 [Actinomadura sp. RB68]|uniref:Uncharacterized protein n=1 Tax=Actinomadura macrotermitis TaxID=2585200 RepID=A0A7K0C5T5_9ACTN|nr:hypothetical protein [Actinomadura macrotermitis]
MPGGPDRTAPILAQENDSPRPKRRARRRFGRAAGSRCRAADPAARWKAAVTCAKEGSGGRMV